VGRLSVWSSSTGQQAKIKQRASWLLLLSVFSLMAVPPSRPPGAAAGGGGGGAGHHLVDVLLHTIAAHIVSYQIIHT
jgi:hypothetical protein